MLDPHGNEVLIDDPFVPPPTDADAPFDPDEDRLEELLAMSLLVIEWKTARGGMRHE
jgi:hypothetical protein